MGISVQFREIEIDKMMGNYGHIYKFIKYIQNSMGKGIKILLVFLFAGLVSCQLLQFDRDIHVDQVIKQHHPALFYLMYDNTTVYESEKIVQQVSNIGNEVLFFSSRRHKCEWFYKLHEFFRTYNVSEPLILYLSSEGKKYLYPDAKVTKQNLIEFIANAQAGKLPVYYQNENITGNNTGPVYVYNANMFKEELINSDQQYVVKFYAPWCMHSQNLAPKFIELAEKMATTNPDIKFVEIDATANEISEVPIEAYPTIYFFKRDKNDAVVRFDGDRNVEEMFQWVQSLVQSAAEPKQDEL